MDNSPSNGNPLQWRHNVRDGVTNYHPNDCLLNRFFSSADQRKHLNSVSLVFVRGIHRWPVNSPHKWPVTRKMFPFDDVIMQTTRITIRVLDMHFKFQAIWPTHTVFVCVYPVMAHFEEEGLYIEAWKACQHCFVSSFLCLFVTIIISLPVCHYHHFFACLSLSSFLCLFVTIIISLPVCHYHHFFACLSRSHSRTWWTGIPCKNH